LLVAENANEKCAGLVWLAVSRQPTLPKEQEEEEEEAKGERAVMGSTRGRRKKGESRVGEFPPYICATERLL